MTRSEEELYSLKLISDLSSNPATVLRTLQIIKHRLIGHDDHKDLLLRSGLARPLIRILACDACMDNDWSDIRVEAGICVGSLVYGGNSYILHLLSHDLLNPLVRSLNPSSSCSRQILCSLRALNAILDTYVAAASVEHPIYNVIRGISTSTVTHYIKEIISQNKDTLPVQKQVSLAASLVAKTMNYLASCSPNENLPVPSPVQSYQSELVKGGVLQALASRLISLSEVTKIRSQYCPSTSLAPILDAISASIQWSRMHSLKFLFSPVVCSVFPPMDGHCGGKGQDELDSENTILPCSNGSRSSLIKAPQSIITPSAFPPLSPTSQPNPSVLFQGSRSYTPHALSNASALNDQNYLLDAVTTFDSDYTAIFRNRKDGTNLEDERVQETMHHEDQRDAERIDDLEESPLIPWLVSIVRSGMPLTRLAAAGVLTDLYLVGILSKGIKYLIALLVVPVVVQLLDGEDVELCSSGGSTVGGVDPPTWARWTIQEKASAVLARLALKSPVFQKAAVDAGAVKRLATVLKQASEVSQNSDDFKSDSADDLRGVHLAEFNHRMRLKEGSLKALANLGTENDEHRRAIIDNGVIQCIVDTCLRPLVSTRAFLSTEPTNVDGNPPSVLIAACNVVRSVSRSVAILRTSLTDAGLAVPMFSLLRHEDLDVRIAATDGVCNLVLDFSPMRQAIIDAGAISLLCEYAKSDNPSLSLSALWSIKHLMWEADLSAKRQAFDALGTGHIMRIICGPMAVAPYREEFNDVQREEAFLEAAAQPSDTQDPNVDLTLPKATAAIARLKTLESGTPNVILRKHKTALQEQAIDFLRNFVCSNSQDTMVEMIDLVFQNLGSDSLMQAFESILSFPDSPGGVINAIVYLLVHIANGAPRHRQTIIDKPELMGALMGLWDHRVSSIRSGLAWLIINLTWPQEGEESEGVRQRVTLLRAMGWEDKLKEMRKDSELDVRERVKAAEYQMGVSVRER